MSTQLWSPSQDRIDGSLLTAFLHRAENKYKISLPTYDAAWDWSVQNPNDFWTMVWKFCEVRSKGTPGPALEAEGTESALIDATFFPKAQLNYAEN